MSSMGALIGVCIVSWNLAATCGKPAKERHVLYEGLMGHSVCKSTHVQMPIPSFPHLLTFGLNARVGFRFGRFSGGGCPEVEFYSGMDETMALNSAGVYCGHFFFFAEHLVLQNC